MSSRFLIASFLGLILSSALSAQDFPQFRGPDGNGHVDNQTVPSEWSDSKNLAWSVSVPGSGWSQPVIVGDKVFLTTAISDKDVRPKNFANGVRTPQSMGGRGKKPDFEIEWKVLCLSAKDGKTLWEKPVKKGTPKFAVHPSNSFATETPVANKNGVYCYFGMAGVVVGFSPEGKQLWKTEVGVYETNNDFGTGSSLAMFDDRIYLQLFNVDKSELLCLDPKTGNKVWSKSRKKAQTSWSTPIVWKNTKRNELIVSAGMQIESFDPKSGKQLWTADKVKSATACSVCSDQNRIYFGGSDPFSKGPLFAVSAGANGNVTPNKVNAQFDGCDWLQPRSAPGMASPVSSGDWVYVVNNGVLRCHDAKTGERKYQSRLPGIRMVNSSPLIVGNQLIVFGESGNACVVEVGSEFKVLGKGKIDDVFWSSPAVSNNALFIRGVKKLYCIRDAEK